MLRRAVILFIVLASVWFAFAVATSDDYDPQSEATSFIGDENLEEDFKHSSAEEQNELQHEIESEMYKSQQMGIAIPSNSNDGVVGEDRDEVLADDTTDGHSLLEALPGAAARNYPRPEAPVNAFNGTVPNISPSPSNPTPTKIPILPTPAPKNGPTPSPTKAPTVAPTPAPSSNPTKSPTKAPAPKTPEQSAVQCETCPDHSFPFDPVQNFFQIINNTKYYTNMQYADDRMNILFGVQERVIPGSRPSQDLDQAQGADVASQCNSDGVQNFTMGGAADGVLAQLVHIVDTRPGMLKGRVVRIQTKKGCDKVKLFKIIFPQFIDRYGSRIYIFWWKTEQSYIMVFRGGQHLNFDSIRADTRFADFYEGDWCGHNTEPHHPGCGRVIDFLYRDYLRMALSTGLLDELVAVKPKVKGLYITGQGPAGSMAAIGTAAVMSLDTVNTKLKRKASPRFGFVYTATFGANRVGSDLFMATMRRGWCGQSTIAAYPAYKQPFMKFSALRHVTDASSDYMSKVPLFPARPVGFDRLSVCSDCLTGKRNFRTRSNISLMKAYYENCAVTEKWIQTSMSCSWPFNKIKYNAADKAKSDKETFGFYIDYRLQTVIRSPTSGQVIEITDVQSPEEVKYANEVSAYQAKLAQDMIDAKKAFYAAQAAQQIAQQQIVGGNISPATQQAETDALADVAAQQKALNAAAAAAATAAAAGATAQTNLKTLQSQLKAAAKV